MREHNKRRIGKQAKRRTGEEENIFNNERCQKAIINRWHFPYWVAKVKFNNNTENELRGEWGVGRDEGRGSQGQHVNNENWHKHSHMFGPRLRLCRRLCLCLRLRLCLLLPLLLCLPFLLHLCFHWRTEAPCRAECIAKMSICCWGCQACHVTLAPSTHAPASAWPPLAPSSALPHAKRVLVSCMNVCGT